MQNLQIPIDLIWGEPDPWKPLQEARPWENTILCIRSLTIIPDAGHCTQNEKPGEVNRILISIIENQSISLPTA